MPIRDENGFELMEHDPVTGRSVWSYFDGEKTVLRTDYPVAEVIKQNEHIRNQSDGWRGDWHHIASVPLNVVHDSGLFDASKQGDDAFTKRWLNDGDNAAWRTKEGRV